MHVHVYVHHSTCTCNLAWLAVASSYWFFLSYEGFLTELILSAAHLNRQATAREGEVANRLGITFMRVRLHEYIERLYS